MGNFFTVAFSKPSAPVVIEEAIEVFETNPTAQVIRVEVIEEKVQYDLD